MVSITAQNILDENNYSTSDCSLVNMERLVDNAIYWVNLMTGRTVSNMGGTAGSKTVSMEQDEASAVKLVSSLLLRGYTDKGPNVGIGGLSVSSIITDPHYSQLKRMIDDALPRLREIEVSHG